MPIFISLSFRAYQRWQRTTIAVWSIQETALIPIRMTSLHPRVQKSLMNNLNLSGTTDPLNQTFKVGYVPGLDWGLRVARLLADLQAACKKQDRTNTVTLHTSDTLHVYFTPSNNNRRRLAYLEALIRH